LNSEEVDLLNKIIETMRKTNPLWAF